MDLETIREIIHLMHENQIAEVDWRGADSHIRIKSQQAAPPPPPVQNLPMVIPQSPSAAPAQIPEQVAAEPVEDGTVVTSPIVGIFYRMPAPDKPAFVDVGDTVDESTVLCIIEAMKVMNEIKAEASGVIKKVLVETGQPVEYGQPLFVIARS